METGTVKWFNSEKGFGSYCRKRKRCIRSFLSYPRRRIQNFRRRQAVTSMLKKANADIKQQTLLKLN